MAKVEIEDRAFQDPGLKVAASKHRVAAEVILGYAASLWRHSQQAGAPTATREQIIGWLDSGRYSKPKKALEWLLTAGFLERTEAEDVMRINGNAMRIERVSKRIENAKAAISARYSKEPSYDSYTKRIPDRETGLQVDNYIPPISPKVVDSRQAAISLVAALPPVKAPRPNQRPVVRHCDALPIANSLLERMRRAPGTAFDSPDALRPYLGEQGVRTFLGAYGSTDNYRKALRRMHDQGKNDEQVFENIRQEIMAVVMRPEFALVRDVPVPASF